MDMSVRRKRKAKRAAKATLAYQSGFGNSFASEAVKGALPKGQNSPQRAPHGLYAEVLSGSAFTAPRAENLSVWTYRLRPSAMQPQYKRIGNGWLRSGPFDEAETPPNRLRWDPFPLPETPTVVRPPGPPVFRLTALPPPLPWVTRVVLPVTLLVTRDVVAQLSPRATPVWPQLPYTFEP